MNGILPGITIVTPSYNQGQFLEDTVLSVLGQSYPDLEYIVMDGGSEDDSVEILRRYEDRIDYWVSEEDRGQSHAINKGFARARGEFVSWLNSDDVLLPDALGRVGDYVQRHPQVDLVIGGLLFGQADGTVSACYLPAPAPPWSMKRGVFDLFQPATFIRKSTLLRFGLLREDLHCRMDTELLTRLARHGTVWGYTPYPLAFFRRHPDCKGNAWEDRYELERNLMQVESDYPAWQTRVVRFIRRVQKLLLGVYIRNWIATKHYQGCNIEEIWEEFDSE